MFFFLLEIEENLWILKILMRMIFGVWLFGCIFVGCFDLCVIIGLIFFFERGNIIYVVCLIIVWFCRNVWCLFFGFILNICLGNLII